MLGLGIDTKVKLKEGSLDALGYLPITSNGALELIGTAGITYIREEANISGAGGSASDDESEWNWRAGGGAEYRLTDNFSLRGLVRYQAADFDDTAKNAVIANIGVNYQF